MAKTLVRVLLLLLAVAGWSSAELSADEQNKCEGEVEKLIPCLQYAQKSTEPSTACCKSVSDIRTADAACLCYLLEATLTGNGKVKELSLDKDRMLALPNVCKLQNTSISDCPALLKLSPGSPDAALFNGSSAAGVSPNVPSTTGLGSSSSSSDAYTLQLPLSRFIFHVVCIAVSFIIFPSPILAMKAAG